MARQHVMFRKEQAKKTNGNGSCPFPIEHGIEVPPHYKARKYPLGLKEMEPGDSRFIPFNENYKKASLQTAFYNYRNEDTQEQEANGKVLKDWVHRMLIEDGVEGMRIFCVKPDSEVVHGRSKVA